MRSAPRAVCGRHPGPARTRARRRLGARHRRTAHRRHPSEERTTPAGRFVAELGVNSEGEDILWVDYDAAISMHRVRATKPVERRLHRLASETPADNRISYGCINLPAAFYDLSVKPAFAASGGIVYVLPETRPLHATFPGVGPAHLARR